MIFVLVLIASIWLALRKGFFFMTAVLFHLFVAIYIGVVSTGQILQISPWLGDSPWYGAACLLLITGLVFTGLLWLAKRSILKHTDNYFGSLLNTVSAAVAGFILGYVVWGFLMLVTAMLPVSQRPFVQNYIMSADGREFGRITITDVCTLVVTMSLDVPNVEAAERVNDLLNLGRGSDSEAAD
jgi:hypothetical protein